MGTHPRGRDTSRESIAEMRPLDTGQVPVVAEVEVDFTHCLCEAHEVVQSSVVDCIVVEVERGVPRAEGVAWCHMTRHMQILINTVALHYLWVKNF